MRGRSLEESESRSVVSGSLRPHGLYSPCNPPGQNTGVGSLSFSFPGDLPNPGIQPRSPTLKADFSPAEPQGKPRNTGLGSLSRLQRLFPTQDSNRGLLYHCRRILYQLSYQRSPSLEESESEVAQLCPTPCQPVDCSPPGFSAHGIFQARVLEWVAISFSKGEGKFFLL